MTELTQEQRDKVLARVRKMMALADNAGATDGERENAMRMAHATLAKYNLEMAEATKEQDPRGRHVATFFSRPWSRDVAHAVAALFFCSYAYVPPGASRIGRHIFVGRLTNALAAEAMARYIVDGIDKESWRRAREHGADSRFARAFCVGAAQVIARRAFAMMETENLKLTAAPGKGLVLADYYKTEMQANEEWKQQNMKTRPGPTKRRVGDVEGLVAGRRYGEGVDLTPKAPSAGALK